MNDQFQLALPNDQWEPAAPAPGQIFLAMHKGQHDRVQPNISADMAEVKPDATLVELADVVSARLLTLDPEARMSKRRVDEAAQTVWQQMDLMVQSDDGTRVPLSQAQVLTVVPGSDGESRTLLCFMLNAETAELPRYAQDFQDFLSSAKAV